MNLTQLLEQQAADMVAAANEALARTRLAHYEKAGAAEREQRLRRLYELVRQSVATRNLAGITDYAQRVAQERFTAGYDIYEVQTAFNVLEEVIWKRIIREVAPATQAEALGLVSTALGAGKDALARTYISLASRAKAPSLDLSALV
jgi:hypothetical protein